MGALKMDLYLPGGQLYRPVPVYFDSLTGDEHQINNAEPFESGCSCSQRGFVCSHSSSCTCGKNAAANELGICQNKRCKACVDNPWTCSQHPGCECRRNAKAAGGGCFGCGAQCHGDAPGVCSSYYDLRPRHELIEVRDAPGKGRGVFATGFIREAQEVGVYSGLMITGSEVLEREGRLRIDTPRSLGVHAYLERVHSVTAPKPKVSQNGRERIEELLAAHIVGGSGWYLASWAGHRIMTWLSADIFKPPPPISLQGLVDDDGRELASTTDEYSMCVGELRKLRCCKRCDSASDGFDYRVFIDADTYGNFTRYINHSCCPNLEVLALRLGSHANALVVPLVVALKNGGGIEVGEELTTSYWTVDKVPRASRVALKAARDLAGEQGSPDYCQCGKTCCSGWTCLPPRDALEAAGVSAVIIEGLH